MIISDEVISNVNEEAGFDLENLYTKLSLALQELRTETLHLIELRFFEQRPFKEIGIILNISENNAKVKTYRAIDQLRKLVNHG